MNPATLAHAATDNALRGAARASILLPPHPVTGLRGDKITPDPLRLAIPDERPPRAILDAVERITGQTSHRSGPNPGAACRMLLRRWAYKEAGA